MPTDEPIFVIKAIHIVWTFLITGGGGAAILTWKLTTKKKRKSLYELIIEHEDEDNKRFKMVDDQSTQRHIEMLEKVASISNDVSFIRGKLAP